MSLPILVAMVVVGITAAVLAVHLTGGSAKARLVEPDQARGRFAEDFPDEAVLAVHITSDAETAFLELAGGRIGIVQVLGDKFLTRIVAPKDIAHIDGAAGATVSISLSDFTWGGGIFRFPDEAAAGAVLRALGTRQATKKAGELA
ncbi:hypothetical protein SAMN04488498_10115 [Mesorhizobium albiziae]|uniref:Uncharacterized protein n=1 Tax=Neomesorhizobium albiziae TaxID=335020 RepID=A0A1I3UU93_9HYPH|nr:hypothetical protein [Mesorhizobium albiziae]GLS28478.1 hypothetical protein GCM10007937_01850 [Mesorhizobium albiziae]SFJ86520.1 hypothetical protein SAMN04488498_10115 [Mesorhizobium albiziae]